jgi:predicted nucleotide-binding protein (sugar kinase/HSP70/actin superfamily)
MGNIYVPLRAIFQQLGVDFVVPPQNTHRTMSLATKHSPEGLCIPFKLLTGNMIEAAEQGADTIVTVGGYGICRLGYYARVQEQVLRDLGYDVKLVLLGVSERKLFGFLQTIKGLSNNASWFRIISAFRFGLVKLNYLDELEKLVQKVRPREKVKGTASQLFTVAREAIDSADDYATLKKVRCEYTDRINNIEADNGFEPLIVGISGEFYVVLEPFSNLDVEIELGKLGVEVRRSTFVSEWTRFSWFLNPLGIDEKDRVHRAAMPYLKRDIGGDGWETVGEKVLHANGYNGIVHLAPFTCMPEIIAQNIMPSTRENIPVLTILCDEQLAKPGVLTRLEAFVDLLWRKKQAQQVKYERAAV